MNLQQFLNRPPVREGFPGQGFLRERLISKLEGLNNLAIEAHTGWGKQMLLKDVGFHLLEKNQSFRLFYFGLKQGESLSDFHLVRGFENYSILLHKFKLCWQKHLHCAYCFSGSNPYFLRTCSVKLAALSMASEDCIIYIKP
jgi:hypothetical protein